MVGKGSFGTDELVQRIEQEGLAARVTHRQVIVPQLGAVGVAAHEVKSRSGFAVIYGPVYARDIKAFLGAGMKATAGMRRVHFGLYDRLVLTPVEIMLSLKYLVGLSLLLVLTCGWQGRAFAVDTLLHQAPRVLANLGGAFLGGAVLGPVLLPWLPTRRFAIKGACVGLAAALGLTLLGRTGAGVERLSWFFLLISVSSFLTMNFTGASTYTSLSGVEREMRTALPAQLVAFGLGTALWIVSRFL